MDLLEKACQFSREKEGALAEWARQKRLAHLATPPSPSLGERLAHTLQRLIPLAIRQPHGRPTPGGAACCARSCCGQST